MNNKLFLAKKTKLENITEYQGLKDQTSALIMTKGIMENTKEIEENEKQKSKNKKDLAAINKKLDKIKKKMQKSGTEAKKKLKEVCELEQEVSDLRLRWDMLQSQLKELGKNMSLEIYKINRDVGDLLQKESCLSIDMYYF